MNPHNKKPGHVGVAGPGINSIGEEGLVIPHVNARAVASVQPWGLREQQHVVQHRGAMIITAYKLGPSLRQVNRAGSPLTRPKQRTEIPA
jgi:hypothetical protein